jgi:hypothetical protein
MASGNTQQVVRTAHLSHVATLLRHIQAVRGQNGHPEHVISPPELFLALEQSTHFWELIGVRVRGHAAIIIGAIRFPRQPSVTEEFARRSLVHYLCSPPKELGMSGVARPARMVQIALPEVDESIPDFLSRFQQGETVRNFFVDVKQIDFAFDFRAENPSAERKVRANQRNFEVHVVRTVAGHILSGRSEGLHMKMHKDGTFLALAQAVQYAPEQTLLLPNLALHRSFISMDAVCTDENTAQAWTRRTVPFLAALANPKHLLDSTSATLRESPRPQANGDFERSG